MATEDESEEQERSPIDQLDLLKSYLAFTWRAIKHRKLVMGITAGVIFAIALVLQALLPRVYNCQSTIMVQASGNLNPIDERGAFRGAGDIIRRRENVLKIIRATDLVRRSSEDRSPLQRLKDVVRGPRPPGKTEDVEQALMYVVMSSLWVQQQGDTLIFGVDWSNPDIAASLVTEAQKIFLEARHVVEISTIQERMVIMDGHAVKVRKEIEAIADQIKGIKTDKAAAAKAARAPAPPAPAPAASSSAVALAPAPAPRPRIKVVTAVPAPVSEADQTARKEQLTTLRDELEVKKRALKDLKDQRTQEMVRAQTQMQELLTKYTPAHPEVVRLQRTIDGLSGSSTRMAPLETEIASLTAKIKELEAPPESSPTTVVARVRDSGGPRSAAAPKPEALPADILQLLDNETETDPAITVQLQGAISKYAGLRDSIRSAQIELDTAQAAFNHRYKIIAPAEPPLKPIKPNVPMIVAGGFFGGLVVALLLAMILELRRGKIVERWQVYQMKLPILAELRLPSGNRE
jgi:polysaccharide biosynthesis transport protein